MNATFEPVCGTIRVFDEGKRYGDPYVWSAGVKWIEKDVVEIYGQMVKLTPSIHKSIITEMRKLGVKWIKSIKYPDGSAGYPVNKWTLVGEEPCQKKMPVMTSQLPSRW